MSTIHSMNPLPSGALSLASQRKRIVALKEAGHKTSHMDLMPRVEQQLPFPSSEGLSLCLDILPAAEIISYTEPHFTKLEGANAP